MEGRREGGSERKEVKGKTRKRERELERGQCFGITRLCCYHKLLGSSTHDQLQASAVLLP